MTLTFNLNRFLFIFFVVAFMNFKPTLRAQTWALKVGFYNVKSNNKIQNQIINDPNQNTFISSYYKSPHVFFNRYVYTLPILSNFFDVSLIRNVSKRTNLIIGYRNFNPVIFSTISNQFGNHTHGETVIVPTIKLNYAYHLLKKDKVNASSFSVFGGLLIHFRGADGTFGSGGWASAVGAVDSSGNFYKEYTIARVVKSEQPKYPMPYLNFGIDGGLRLGKRFKIGLSAEASVGYKTLYVQKIEGFTNSATFTYEIKLKPYFFSGGIYLQYRLK